MARDGRSGGARLSEGCDDPAPRAATAALVDMAARSSGGKRASGRYRAYDSAQLLHSTAVAFPTRQFGTRIDAEDWRLSIPPPSRAATRRDTLRRSQHRYAHRAGIGWMCASEKTALDTLWMNWCAMERAKRSGRIRQSLAGRPGMADLEWIGSSHYLYSVSRGASRSLFMLLELETAGRHVCRNSWRWSSVLATHGRHASTYTTARLRRMVRATHARACMHAPTATHRTTQTQTSISNECT